MGWSFSNIYSLKALRDIFIIISDADDKGVGNVTSIFREKWGNDSKNWDERTVLEYIKALKNFRLINRDNSTTKACFENREVSSPLNQDDLGIFREIFYSYFRFMEISSWFISPDYHKYFETISEEILIEKSAPLYFFCNANRFTDTFLYSIENNSFKYIIEDRMSHLMRFWDVFLKWGTTLGVVDKFNLSRIGIKANDKDLSIAYFIKPFERFNLLKFITNSDRFDSQEIYLPDLIFEIARTYRFSVKEIKSFIVEELNTNDKFTYERTSKIFIIKGKESRKKIEDATYLYPIVDDSFVSHLILRK